MGSMGLDHPSDIKWERRCASEDMIDADLCSGDSPAKWRSSLSLFTYTPDDEYQVYEGREIVYLKVAATLAGYQPKSQEIEGEVDWGDFETEVEEDFQSMLDDYEKCTGGLLEVSVGPPEENEDDWAEESYPYVADYQPKRRALYTMATETNSRMSRTLEETRIRKAAGTTESNEVLDVDLGGSQSWNAGANVGVGPVQVGLQGGRSTANRQRVGSKQMDQATEQRVQSSSRSQEQREGYSHTTQLTQLHHLLDSYHKGTNRALFFFLPRPYVKEEPTGFVRGPRGIDGVQEVFLVVNKPEEMDDVNVSVRLDTGHYTVQKEYDYDYTSDVVSALNVSLAPPERDNPDAANVGTKEVDIRTDIGNVRSGTAYYECYELTEQNVKTWRPENHGHAGYEIDTSKGNGGWEYVPGTRQVQGPGSDVSVTVGGGGEYLTIETEATSRACYYDRATLPEWTFRIDDVRDEVTGRAEASVKVYLKSTEKDDVVGTSKVLLITTRGLCCGPDDRTFAIPDETPVDRIDVGDRLRRYAERELATVDVSDGGGDDTPADTVDVDETVGGDDAADVAAVAGEAAGAEANGDGGALDVAEAVSEAAGNVAVGDRTRATSDPDDPERMTIHEANYLGTEVTRQALGKAARNRGSQRARSVLEADYTVDRFANLVRESERGRRRLRAPAADVDAVLTGALAEAFEDGIEGLTRRDVVDADTDRLERITGLDRATINRGKLAMLGVPLTDTRGTVSREDGGDDDAAGDAGGDDGDDDGDDGPDVSVDVEADLDGDDEPEVDVEVEADLDDDSDEGDGGDGDDGSGS